jgi:heparin/heparan-sulfate lyase
MDWCRLPGNKEFGAGDSFHNNNLLPKDIPTHIKEIANLFGRNHPKVLDWASELVALYNKGYNPMRMTFMPLLHNFNFTLDEYTEPAKHKSCVTHFESLGQIIMRTGRGDNDTYAMFMTGRSNDQHQHFDINNFTIYKHGYRALDSGTRPQPGLHLSHYYARTVAHNCITIRMPGEEMPHYWGGAAKEEDENTPFPNDGGQRVRNKGKLLALNESDDYVYIASDATEAYHEDKAEQVVREFVWLKPDIFVIYDRVVSDKAEYPKRWLYHIASEPIMNGKMEFSEVSQGGKSICRTLLPKKAKLELVGGEGKQFWSEGRNWPIPDMHKSWLKNTNPLMGQWRVEVSPKKAATRDHFLHIVQVGDKNLAALPKTKCEESKESATLSFDYEGQHYSLTFDKRANYGCKIKIDKL